MLRLRLILVAVSLTLAGCGDFVSETASVEDAPGDAEKAETLNAVLLTEDVVLDPEAAAIRSAQANLLMLTEYVNFLEQVKVETGEYPQTRSMRSAFNAMKDLAEPHGVTLPETPQTAEEDTRGRFAYRSDGTDYKLVAERTGDCFAVRDIDPARVDPKRASGPVDCYGYGFWTDGAVSW